MHIRFILAVGLLAGTIIGAGIFSLPYVFSTIGVGFGVGYLLLFGFLYASLYEMYASVLSLEPGKHDLFFLVKKHLPFFMTPVVVINTLFGILFALLAYLTLIPSFLSFAFGIEGWWIVFLFWLLCSAFFFVKADSLGLAEFIGTASIFSAVLFILFFAFRSGSSVPPLFSSGISTGALLLPFGPILFSFSGRSAVSHVVRLWKESRRRGGSFKMKNAIRLGVFIPVVTYAVFVIAVIALNPSFVSTDGISGLSLLPLYAKVILGIVGFLTLWTSYIMLGVNVKDILLFDSHTPKWVAFGIPLVIPPILFLLGFDDFMEVLSISGGIFIAIEGILITWIWLRAFPRHKNRWYAVLPVGVFLISFFYTCSRFLF